MAMDYLGGQSREQLEALLRRLVTEGPEGTKVDFKRALAITDKAAQAELAKDISSIANSDDEVHLDDFGYLILGAERGSVLGGVTELSGDMDKLQARITDVIKNFTGPVPQFSLHAFEDPKVGWWGALVIPPSARQPHMFVRDGAGDVVKHEWWVRVNDTKERAGPQDFARILSKAARREVRPLEREVQRLALLVEQQRGAPDMATLVEALRGSSSSSSTRSTAGDAESLAGSVRELLVRGSHAVEDTLVAEALRLAEVMAETSERNPWVFERRSPAQLRDILDYLEEQSFPLADAMATVARYDREGLLHDAVCRALNVIAREPQAVGVHYRYAPQFRLYPLVLCLYFIVIVAVNERRTELLKRVFGLSMEREERDGVEPIVVSFRRIRAASDLFKAALEKDYFEPVAVRVREVALPRLAGLLAGTQSADAFFVAEFVIGLAFLKVSGSFYHGSLPLPGCYTYESAAQRAIRRFLQRRPAWLETSVGGPLEKLLEEFDQTAAKVVQQPSWSDGFVSGAASAYREHDPGS